MLNTILALLAVLTVMAAHALYRLVRLPSDFCAAYSDTKPRGPN